MISDWVRRFRIALIVQFLAVIMVCIEPELSMQVWKNTFQFSLEVFGILPPVMLCLGLLDVWIPSDAVESQLGVESGIYGMVMAFLLGAVGVGPLFAAFPIAKTLFKRGGRTANIVIFLGSWATIKVPILLMESRFLGLDFAVLRILVTVPFIILIGMLMERFVTQRS